MPTTMQFKSLSKYRILLSSRFPHIPLCARKSLNHFTKTSYVYFFPVLFGHAKLIVEIVRSGSGSSYTMETGK